MQGLSSNRVRTGTYVALIAALMMATPLTALADPSACSANDSSLNCRLLGLLHWLEAAAVVLGIVLIAVIAVAIHLYRKNRLSRKEGR